MSQENYNTKNRKNKHLNYREKYTTEILLKEKMTVAEISKRLGRHKRTIEREIAKGTVWLLNSDLSYRQEYSADKGQMIYDKNSRNKGPGLKIGKDHKLAKYIEQNIVKRNIRQMQ